MRKVKFQTGEYYHIYNRGVDKREVFCNEKDFIRFLTGMREFNKKETINSLYRLNQIKKKRLNAEKEAKLLRFSASAENRRSLASLVGLISYSLIPNHYHFILKQSMDNGIKNFMHKLGTGYTNYFNAKHKRSGSLFQGPFNAVPIKDSYYLCKLLIYVNYNYEIHNLGKAGSWPWSSYSDIIGKRNGTLCNLNIIKEEFGTVEEFKNLAAEIIPEIKENKKLRKYLLE